MNFNEWDGIFYQLPGGDSNNLVSILYATILIFFLIFNTSSNQQRCHLFTVCTAIFAASSTEKLYTPVDI